jgi:Bacterial RNA polymerase, alpha chain C terminal domain
MFVVSAQVPDVLINEHPRLRLDGLKLYAVIRGDIHLNYGWGDRYEFLHQPDPSLTTGRATNLIRGYVAKFRLEPDGGLVLEEYQFPSGSFRPWGRQPVAERLTGDFWIVLKPAFFGQRVYVPFCDGRIVEERGAWVIEPYDAPRMRESRIDLEGLDAFMASSRARDEALKAEVAVLNQRDPSLIPVAELELSVPATDALERAGLTTLGDLCARTADALKRDIGLSENSVEELREALAYFDRKLKGD